MTRTFHRVARLAPGDALRHGRSHRFLADDVDAALRTDLTPAQIAERTGYHNPEYFSAAFKQAQGQPLGAYRSKTRWKTFTGRRTAIGWCSVRSGA